MTVIVRCVIYLCFIICLQFYQAQNLIASTAEDDEQVNPDLAEPQLVPAPKVGMKQ